MLIFGGVLAIIVCRYVVLTVCFLHGLHETSGKKLPSAVAGTDRKAWCFLGSRMVCSCWIPMRNMRSFKDEILCWKNWRSHVCLKESIWIIQFYGSLALYLPQCFCVTCYHQKPTFINLPCHKEAQKTGAIPGCRMFQPPRISVRPRALGRIGQETEKDFRQKKGPGPQVVELIMEKCGLFVFFVYKLDTDSPVSIIFLQTFIFLRASLSTKPSWFRDKYPANSALWQEMFDECRRNPFHATLVGIPSFLPTMSIISQLGFACTATPWNRTWTRLKKTAQNDDFEKELPFNQNNCVGVHLHCLYCSHLMFLVGEGIFERCCSSVWVSVIIRDPAEVLSLTLPRRSMLGVALICARISQRTSCCAAVFPADPGVKTPRLRVWMDGRSRWGQN